MSTCTYNVGDPVTRELRSVLRVREVLLDLVVAVNLLPEPFDGAAFDERHRVRLDVVAVDVLLLARIELLQEVLYRIVKLELSLTYNGAVLALREVATNVMDCDVIDALLRFGLACEHADVLRFYHCHSIVTAL